MNYLDISVSFHEILFSQMHSKEFELLNPFLDSHKYSSISNQQNYKVEIKRPIITFQLEVKRIQSLQSTRGTQLLIQKHKAEIT